MYTALCLHSLLHSQPPPPQGSHTPTLPSTTHIRQGAQTFRHRHPLPQTVGSSHELGYSLAPCLEERHSCLRPNWRTSSRSWILAFAPIGEHLLGLEFLPSPQSEADITQTRAHTPARTRPATSHPRDSQEPIRSHLLAVKAPKGS